MPRASDGAYSLPVGSIVNTGDTILPSQHNPPLQDIAQALSNSVDRDGKGGMRAPLNMAGNRITNAAPGIASTDLATIGQSSIPIGTVLDFAGLYAPDGFALCFGQTVSRAEYPELFALLGTAYGPGNGTTTFNLPDARGRVIAGPDNMGGTAAARLTGALLAVPLGEQAHILTNEEMPIHAHAGSTNTDGQHFHTLGAYTGQPNNGGGPAGSSDIGSVGANVTNVDGAHSHSFTTATAGSGLAHNNVQPTLVLSKIIKVRAS